MKSFSLCVFATNLPGRSILLSFALLVFAFILLFINLGGASTLLHHESLVALTAREMFFNGNWLVPYFNGVPRLEKTPLAYWMVAGFGFLFGEINEWTVRLPAALSGLALAALVGSWAYQWYGIRAGLCAALIQSTVLYTIKWGRNGTIDMLLCLLTTAALYVAAKAAVSARDDADSSRRRHYYFGISWCFFVGLATLAKPLFGIIMVATPCLVFLLLYRRSGLLIKLVHPVGLVLFLILTLTWPYLILQEIPSAWQIWHKETLHRAVDTGRYYEPVWFYGAVVPYLVLPWTPFLLLSMIASWRKARRDADAKERFLWIWFLTQAILLSLSNGKNQHYVLPALPALSLMGGQALDRWLARFDGEKSILGLRGALVIATSSVFIAIGAVLMLSRQWPANLLLPLWLCAGAFTLGSSLCGYLLWVSYPLRAVVVGCATFAVIFAISSAQISPVLDSRRPAVDFARSVSRYVPQGAEVTIYKAAFTSLVFYADRGYPREDTLSGLQKRLAQERRLFVLAGIETMGEIKTLGQVSIVAEMTPSPPAKRRRPQLVLLEVSV